jgi:hypothetical protein
MAASIAPRAEARGQATREREGGCRRWQGPPVGEIGGTRVCQDGGGERGEIDGKGKDVEEGCAAWRGALRRCGTERCAA